MKPTIEDISALLADIAPEVDMTQVDRDGNLQSELDIDSMDFLNFVVALAKKYGVDIPEADYPRLASLNGCLFYVSEKLGIPT